MDEQSALPTSFTRHLDGMALGHMPSIIRRESYVISEADVGRRRRSAPTDGRRRLPKRPATLDDIDEDTNVVLLNMDAFQESLDMVEALIRKGSKPTSTIYAVTPMPIVKTARALIVDTEKQVLFVQQQQKVFGRHCVPHYLPTPAATWTTIRRGCMFRVERGLLALTTCWMGVENTADGHRLINAHLHYTPRLMTLAANDDGDGVIEILNGKHVRAAC